MRTIKVTELEKQVLEALANEMNAEYGFSNAGLPEVVQATGLSSKVVRGIQSSLIKKELLYVDDRKDEMDINWRDPNMHIWYLQGPASGLVEHWVAEEGLEPTRLIVG